MKKLLLNALLMILVSAASAEPLIVAHRGASKDAPENTLPAFNLAWKQGADAIEGDFHLTKDGHIVCIHNYDTKKVAGKKLVVSKSSLEDLRKLDVGSYHGAKFKGTTIPTIAEVFATVPAQKRIFVEIKCGVEIIPPLLAAIKKSNLKKEQIVLICFDKNVIQQIKAKAPQYKASWLFSIKNGSSIDKILKNLQQIKADGFSSSSNIKEAFTRKVIQHGYDYHVWTVNDLNKARRFTKWGAKSITTDIPGQMRKNL